MADTFFPPLKDHVSATDEDDILQACVDWLSKGNSTKAADVVSPQVSADVVTAQVPTDIVSPQVSAGIVSPQVSSPVHKSETVSFSGCFLECTSGS